MRDAVLQVAAIIVGASCAGHKGDGMHKSPALVADAVDLAEMLVSEVDRRADARDAELPPPAPTASGLGAPTPPPAA